MLFDLFLVGICGGELLCDSIDRSVSFVISVDEPEDYFIDTGTDNRRPFCSSSFLTANIPSSGSFLGWFESPSEDLLEENPTFYPSSAGKYVARARFANGGCETILESYVELYDPTVYDVGNSFGSRFVPVGEEVSGTVGIEGSNALIETWEIKEGSNDWAFFQNPSSEDDLDLSYARVFSEEETRFRAKIKKQCEEEEDSYLPEILIVTVVDPYTYTFLEHKTRVENGGVSISTGREQLSSFLKYYDGLGRPIQEVLKEYTPSAQSLIVPILYSEFHRRGLTTTE